MRERLSAERLDGRSGVGGGVGVAPVAERDVGALAGEREDDGAPFISVSKMQRNGYLRGIAQLDKAYDMVDRYCDRIEGLRDRQGGLLSADQLLPRENELPGIRNGRRKSVSKRLFLIGVLGFLPEIRGWQP